MDRPVSEVMSREMVVLEEWENLLDVARDMNRHHLRHLPVVDDGRLVGLVSHRDLLKFTTSSLDSTAAAGLRDFHKREQTFVREIMTTPVLCVKATTPVLEAVQMLVQAKFGALPVVDDDDMLVGIVSEHDLLKVLAGMLTGEMEQWDAARAASRLVPSMVDRDDPLP